MCIYIYVIYIYTYNDMYMYIYMYGVYGFGAIFLWNLTSNRDLTDEWWK